LNSFGSTPYNLDTGYACGVSHFEWGEKMNLNSSPEQAGSNPDQVPRIAILIPCLNEEQTIGQVVQEFKVELPEAKIYVVDNDSTDNSVAEAQAAGASVMTEKRRGKGYVVQTMFQKVDADVYVIVDGDGTYPASKVHDLISPIQSDEADMVVGSRTADATSIFHPLNRLGNKFYQYVINFIFGTRLSDILSGYRSFNRKFVKGLPLFVTGFEVETELTIKALQRGYRIDEVPVALRPRPAGSRSKIRVINDGMKILLTILALFRDYKPLTFFGGSGALLILLGLIPGGIAVYEFLETGLVLRFPSAILSVGMILSGMLLIVVGLILHTINRRFQELEYYVRLLSD
jgi:glycosyltransferase involved in cell wall biosynthesis